MKLRIVIFWVAASLCLVALLFAQRQMMLDTVQEELEAEAQAQAKILARELVRTLLDARVETDADIDEFVVRQPVFDFMENRSVLACAVYGKDRLLEAQMRDRDGNLAPLDGLASPGMCEWTERLVTDTGEEMGKVWIALDPAPWQARMQKISDKSLWHMVALSQAGAVAIFAMGLLFAVAGRRKRDARDQG